MSLNTDIFYQHPSATINRVWLYYQHPIKTTSCRNPATTSQTSPVILAINFQYNLTPTTSHVSTYPSNIQYHCTTHISLMHITNFTYVSTTTPKYTLPQRLVKSLYHNSSCSIRIAQKQTRSLRYERGVRQGCIVSPLLFNFYIHDLPFAFENTLSDPFVLPNGAKLNSLLYADDLIILSRSKTGQQNCLDKLSSFCPSWMMKINPKKTKIIVFQKRARKECWFSLSHR